MKKLIFGIGNNDANYAVSPRVGGIYKRCPFYMSWQNMFMRCYSDKYHAATAYSGCSVAKEWHSFMAFRDWMRKQDWQGKELDKDVLVEGNKVYSAATCVFVDKTTNHLLLNNASARGGLPVGVTWKEGRYQASVRSGGRLEHLGLFDTPAEAHAEWRKAKAVMFWQASKKQSDPRVVAALQTRSLKLIAGI